MKATYQGYNQAAKLHSELTDRLAALKQSTTSPETLAAAQALDGKALALTDSAGPPAGLGPMNRDLTRLMIAVDQSDTPPAGQIIETFTGMCQDTRAALQRWNDLRTHDMPQLNAMLAQQALAPLTVPSQALEAPDCGN
jgi:hypothetical protein